MILDSILGKILKSFDPIRFSLNVVKFRCYLCDYAKKVMMLTKVSLEKLS